MIEVTATVTDATGNTATASVTAELGHDHNGGVTRVLTHGEHFPDGFTVPAGEVWAFDASHAGDLVLVTSAGNVVVEGTLRMGYCHCDHVLRFTDVDEAAFVGGGMTPLASDVGLWVMHHGQLDIEGNPRAGWNRTGTDPTWQAGDEIRSAPNTRGDFDTYLPHTPGALVPTVYDPWGGVHPTEVFNLTRSVRIEGTPGHRAHVFIHSMMPQRIRFARFNYLGPRRPASVGTTDILGRYPVHFHHCHDDSRGSLVEGCVVTDSSRAFVTHASHGVTVRDCVAHRITDDAFWWDSTQDAGGMENNSHDTLWDHCGVFGVVNDPTYRNLVCGFRLGSGDRNTVRDSVCVGADGSSSASGFQWPEKDHDVWTAENLVAHNNKADGIFVWQNDELPHLVDGFTGYHNDDCGIQHGAYLNGYHYRHLVLFGNGTADLMQQAMSVEAPEWPEQRWEDVAVEHLVLGDHNLDGRSLIVFDNLRCERVTVNETRTGRGDYELRCAPGHDLEPGDFTLLVQKSTIRVIRGDGSSFMVA